MSRAATAWRWLTGAFAARGAEIRLSLRVTTAGLVTYALSEALHVPLVLWSVLTAVVVTQLSVGKSLQATFDYFRGTLGGAVYAGIVGSFVPHASELALLGTLALVVVPVALLAAVNPRFGAAPFTAVLVLLVPAISHVSAVGSAFDRILEVALGGAVALAVSLVVFPARAHALAVKAAAKALDLLAQAVVELVANPGHRLAPGEIQRVQDRIGQALTGLETVWSDATQERMTHLAAEADLAPLLRTLVRLRQDLIVMGRAMVMPPPETIEPRFGPLLDRVAAAAADFLRSNGVALLTRGATAPLAAVDAAIAEYRAEVDRLRGQGLLHALPVETVERVFTLCFALEQMQRNFVDLARCVAEADAPPGRARRAAKA